MRHQNRTAVVLGGGRDVGRATVLQLVAEQADVIVADISADDVTEVCAAGGPSVRGHVLDVADPDALAALAREVEETWPVLNVLVTYYNSVDRAPLEQLGLEGWEQTVRENLTAPFVASMAFLPLLKRAPGAAAVVHFTSVDGLFGNPTIPAYSATKGGVVALIHVQAAEFATHGIRVNGVARAATAEVVAELHIPQVDIDRLRIATPLGRIGSAAETAAVAAFLASDEASYVTGVVIPVDGGRTAITPGTLKPAPG